MTAARLFCIPHAGGSANSYRPWGPLLGDEIELCPVELPGRGHHLATPPLTSLNDLVDVVTDYVLARSEVPFALLGHSFGALLAFESARVLQACGAAPSALFVSGHRAPHLKMREKPICHLPDTEFLTEITLLGGTPPGFLDNTELVELVLPALRADFGVSDNYRYRPGAPVRCPVTAFAGAADPHVRITDLDAWRRHTDATFRLQVFPGDHFYLYDRTCALLRELAGARWWESAEPCPV